MARTAPARAPSRLRRARGATLGLAAAVVALAAMLAVSVVVLSRGATVDSRRDEALAAARQGVVNFTSLDYRSLDGQFRLIEKNGTGAFLEDLKAHEAQLRKTYTADQIVSRGTVLDAALLPCANGHETCANDDATAVLFVDATLSAKSVKTPVRTRYRARVHLVRSGSRWLVEEVTPVA